MVNNISLGISSLVYSLGNRGESLGATYEEEFEAGDKTGKMSGGGLRSVAWASVIKLVEPSVMTLRPGPGPT